MKLRTLLLFICMVALASGVAFAQSTSIAIPWSGHAHDSQHGGISQSGVAAQTLGRIRWQNPVDLNPQVYDGDLYIHYGSPLVTQSNTVIFPVKTGTSDGFRVEAHAGTTGSTIWAATTDYSIPPIPSPPYGWTPSCGIALTPKNRLYFPGAGGTVYYRDSPDAPAASGTGQIAFYGIANYQADTATFNADIQISTPITSDRYGNIFFGFQVSGSPTVSGTALQSGLARISVDGSCAWVGSTTISGTSGGSQIEYSCAPALSNDHKTLYVAINSGYQTGGTLAAVDSRTLAPLYNVRLKDVLTPANDATMDDEGSPTPTIGPDGDVYFGVLENPFYSNHLRGWLLHFDSTLAHSKIPGAFGWDDTASIVPASLVPSYHGSSTYLLLTKYNNYIEGNGDGKNKLAILDPNATETDPISGATVMNEVITVLGVTQDEGRPAGAVREWCVNTVAIDPATRSAIVNSEDGHAYRWDFTSNALVQSLMLTNGIGEAYTPTVIGVDGASYIIENATLFCVGQ